MRSSPTAAFNGLSVDAHVGRRLGEILPGLPKDEIERGWRTVMETGAAMTGIEVCGETPAAPGRKRFWRADWYRVRAHDRTFGACAMVREITSEKERDDLQRILMGIVGHDLRNPLSVVTMALGVLLQGDELPPHARSLASRAQRAAGHIEALARDLLDFTALQRDGELPTTPRRTDLREIIRVAADEIEAGFPGVVLDLTGPKVVGEWDPERLRQLLANLLSNAARYGERGAPVVVRWTDGELVVLTVTNRGEPIGREGLAHLFDGATRPISRDARRKGTGLGLFIARAIAHAHGGRIAAASEAESGTTFTVELPRSGRHPRDPAMGDGAPRERPF